MIRLCRHLAFLFALCALTTTSLAQTPPPPTSSFRHEIKPGKIEEECRALKSGARVAYRYIASEPVPFNVHFHKGNAVEYPVKIDASAGEAGTFIAPSQEEYCWMWTNTTNRTVKVEGTLETLR
jgi:hypothetical protein